MSTSTNHYYVYHEALEPGVKHLPKLGTYGPYSARSAREALERFLTKYAVAGDTERLRVSKEQQ